MQDKSITRGLLSFAGLIVVALVAISPAPASERTDNPPAQALADLAGRVFSCAAHPCLGESEQVVRKALRGQIVSDGTFYYSDLAVAYPSVAHILRGLVEWDFEGSLDMVSFKVVDLHVAPAVLIAELNGALPGCEMEQDQEAEGDGESEAWSCEADGPASSQVLVEVYFAPGLVLLEIGS